jgi:Cdc6-like AAA superfamily ATPase
MNNQPALDTTHLRYTDWLIANLILYGFFLAVFSPFAALVAYVYESRQVSKHIQIALIVVSFIWFVSLSRIVSLTDILTIRYWFLSVPLFPIGALTLRGIRMFSNFSKPKTLQEHLIDEERKLRAQDERLESQAQARREGQLRNELLTLGAVIKSDIFPEHLGVSTREGWLSFGESVLDQHLFLLGTTGAGKSETIKRLIFEILKNTSRNVYLVDGKGDEGLALDVRSLAHHFGRGSAPVFRLGFDTHGAVYDGFRGQRADVYNRLCALVGVAEVEGGARYYADLNRDLLQLVCYAPAGVPRGFEEVRHRLDKDWLLEAYRDDPEERAAIAGMEEKDIQGLARRIRPLEREFSPIVGPDGFSLEDTSCAIFSMRVQSVGDTSKRFLDFLVEDIKDFVGKRQKQPAVLVIDEFGQFSNNNIISLLTLARSSKLGVILATQDTASLKDDATKRLVLANTRTKILMASDFPEEVGELAGTIYRIESSMQHSDGEITGTGSARVQHAFKVDMNEAAKLKPGEAFVIRQRHAAKVMVRAIGEVEPFEAQEPEIRQRIVETREPSVGHKRPPKL